jgi:tRNA A37 threonylcarbamoyladenosine modification protein TsaB
MAVAENAADLDCEHLAVVLDAKFGTVYAARFALAAGRPAPIGKPALLPAGEFFANCPRPVTLLGEGLGYHDLSGEGVTIADESLWLPRAEGVWRAGRRLADKGQFVTYQELRPLYLRQPEAVRLWNERHG